MAPTQLPSSAGPTLLERRMQTAQPEMPCFEHAMYAVTGPVG